MARPIPVEAPVTTTLVPASAWPALPDRVAPACRSVNRLPPCRGFRRVAGSANMTGAATRHKGTRGRGQGRTSMRLLISVSSGAEVEAALEGGADIIDAKDPAAGPLGAVSGRALGEIVRAVDGRLPVSAALGDASDEVAVALAARRVATHRLAYLKIGFAGISDRERVESLVAAAVHGACLVSASIGVIAVGYADYLRPDVASLSPWWLVEAAERAGALGVLLDTAVKHRGPPSSGHVSGLFRAMSQAHVSAWIRHAHDADLTVAVAGGLAGADLSVLRSLGADVVGVRGAACEGGDRLAQVSRANVEPLARSAGRRSWPGSAIGARPMVVGEAAGGEPPRSRAALQ